MKRQEFFGEVRRLTDITCSYDAGIDHNYACGTKAVWHGWAGEPPDTRLDAAVFACEEHFQILTGRLWDYHEVGGACGIPGAIWFSGASQGQGCCKHDLDFETVEASMVEPTRDGLSPVERAVFVAALLRVADVDCPARNYYTGQDRKQVES